MERRRVLRRLTSSIWTRPPLPPRRGTITWCLRRPALSKAAAPSAPDQAQGGLQPPPASANWQICSGWPAVPALLFHIGALPRGSQAAAAGRWCAVRGRWRARGGCRGEPASTLRAGGVPTRVGRTPHWPTVRVDPNPNPEKCRRASPGYSSGRGGKSGQVSCSVSSSAGGSLCEKARPMWPASQNISANWPRLAEAGGRPELDLALAGRARGRIGRSPWAAGFHTGGSLSAVPIMVMQVSADGLRKVSVHRPSCVSSAWRERVVRSAPSAGTRASPQRRRRR